MKTIAQALDEDPFQIAPELTAEEFLAGIGKDEIQTMNMKVELAKSWMICAIASRKWMLAEHLAKEWLEMDCSPDWAPFEPDEDERVTWDEEKKCFDLGPHEGGRILTDKNRAVAIQFDAVDGWCQSEPFSTHYVPNDAFDADSWEDMCAWAQGWIKESDGHQEETDFWVAVRDRLLAEDVLRVVFKEIC